MTFSACILLIWESEFKNWQKKRKSAGRESEITENLGSRHGLCDYINITQLETCAEYPPMGRFAVGDFKRNLAVEIVKVCEKK